MHIMDFNILPLLVFLPSIYILVFLFHLPKKAGFKKTLVISGVFTGFFGFFLSFPIPLNNEYFYDYFLLPCAFLLLFLVASLGAFFHNINPFSPNSLLFLPKLKKEKIKEKENSIIFEQTSVESTNLVNLLLHKLPDPISIFKNKILKNGNEDIFFPFIFITPKGIFTVFPCNWSGKISFRNDTLARFINSENDILTADVYDDFKEKIIQNILSNEGFKKIPVHKIIVTTNPSAYFEGNIINDSVSVVDLGNFNEFLNKFPSDIVLTPNNIIELESLIQLN